MNGIGPELTVEPWRVIMRSIGGVAREAEKAAGVAVKRSRKAHAAAVHPATAETITKETVSSEHPKQKDYPHPPTTGASPVVLVVTSVH